MTSDTGNMERVADPKRLTVANVNFDRFASMEARARRLRSNGGAARENERRDPQKVETPVHVTRLQALRIIGDWLIEIAHFHQFDAFREIFSLDDDVAIVTF